MNDALQIMGALREAGAVGGMAFDPAGRVLVHTMPPFFPTASIQAAGERMTIFQETVAENFEPVTEVVMAFDGYVLLLRRAPELLLAVVMNDSANREAVKMASNLVFRRLVTSRAAITAPARVAAPPALPPSGPASAQASVRIPGPPRSVSSNGAPRTSKPAAAAPPLKPKKKNDIWGD